MHTILGKVIISFETYALHNFQHINHFIYCNIDLNDSQVISFLKIKINFQRVKVNKTL
jgi:hypothetical protein